MNKYHLDYLKVKYNIIISPMEVNNLSACERFFAYEIYSTRTIYFHEIINNVQNLVHITSHSDCIAMLAYAFKINKFDEILSLVLMTKYNSIGTECKQFLDKYLK